MNVRRYRLKRRMEGKLWRSEMRSKVYEIKLIRRESGRSGERRRSTIKGCIILSTKEGGIFVTY
jgi:hypothetical protein